MYKKIFTFIAICLLFLPVLVPLSIPVRAASKAKIEILEIIDKPNASGVEVSTLNLDPAKYDVTTMAMKRFVASREDLDGKYDAIYIAQGTYSTAFPRLDPDPAPKNPNDANRLLSTNAQRTAEIQTRDKMNDLTLLKAKEIETAFIKKNLPVIVHESVLDQQENAQQIQERKSVLKDTFTKYKNEGTSNVYFIKSVQDFPTLTLYRPHITMTSTPSEYKGSTSTIYKPGNTIPFSFQVQNGDASQLTANLYIDTNFNNKFEPTERISSYSLNDMKGSNGEYSFTYTLPRGYSGVRTWKLEVIDRYGLKDYVTGMFRFQDEPVDIHVLQVTSGTNNNANGNLINTLSSIPKKGNVIQTDDYKITIDVTDLGNFSSCTRKPCYTDLNSGIYNMVVLGFQDTYGKTRIGKAEASQALKQFVDTGQSVFMTHDTLVRYQKSGNLDETTNSWITSLMPYAGQNYEIGVMPDYQTKSMDEKIQSPGNYFMETNFGMNAVVTVNNTKKVNSGLITSYPYSLGNNVSVATTHSQYFALNLEDPDVIPWYNLSGNRLDANDSYNHYYIYSRNNITYTGAGHTNNGFSTAEQQLFLNTMYTAFSGANHAPLITVYSPQENDQVLSNQKVNLSFKVEDLDAKDKNMNVQVFFNNQSVYQDTVNNGATITRLLEHGMAQGGPLEIRIEATDEAGAKTVQVIHVNVMKVNANVNVTRQLEKTDVMQVGTPVNIHYTITPQAVTTIPNTGDASFVLKNVQFTEKFPDNIKVRPLDNRITVRSDKSAVANFGDIVYKKNANGQYTADPITFDIEVTPTAAGQYTLNQSSLQFTALDNTNKQLKFEDLTITAKQGLNAIKPMPSLTMNVDSTPQNILYSFDPSTAKQDGIVKTMKWEVQSGQQYIDVDQNGVVKVKPNLQLSVDKVEASVKVTAIDIFGHEVSGETKVTIYNPIRDIQIANEITLYEGETKSLNFAVIPASARDTVSWDPGDQTIASVNTKTGEVTGVKKGDTIIKVSGLDVNQKPITKQTKVHVLKPVTQITANPSEVTLIEKNTYRYQDITTITVTPSDADLKDIIWSLKNPADEKYVTVTADGVITTKLQTNGNPVPLLVTAKDGQGAFTVVNVYVKPFYIPLENITFSGDKVRLEVGQSKNLNDLLQFVPVNATNKTIQSWQAIDPRFVTMKQDGIVTGIAKGYTTVIATAKDGGKTARIVVEVVEKGTDGTTDPSTNDTPLFRW